MIDKTRDLPLMDFLDQLQLEYIVAELRSKIYKKEKDKRFWFDRVAKGKEKKISDIFERNPESITIFNSKKEMKRFKAMVYNPWGLPSFYYRNKEQREELEIKDVLNYFEYGQEFLLKTDIDENKRAILISILEDGKRVTWANYKTADISNIKFGVVKIKGKKELSTIHLSNLVRIF